MKLSNALFAPLLLSILASLPVSALAAGGELWETRSTMVSSVHGPMDLGVNRECRPGNWRDKPEFKTPGNGECSSNQVERRGNEYVWKFNCGGTQGEGSARILGPDRLDAKVRMDTPQGRFTLNMQSRKLGSCKRG